MLRSLNNDTTNSCISFLEASDHWSHVMAMSSNCVSVLWQGSSVMADDDSNRSGNAANEAEALASQLPLTQIGAIPLEDIIGEIPENRCLQMFDKYDNRFNRLILCALL